jgi:flagellar basal-body rod modification protein FlgD
MIGAIGEDPTLAPFGIRSAAANETGDSGSLGQEEFLRLMITQLKNQDPTKPLESGEFLGQLAQFGTVSGLASLQDSFQQLAGSLVSNQALQAAGLVGRSVLARSDLVNLEAGGGVNGALDLPVASGDVRVQVVDASGQLIKEISLGAQPSGLARFSWAGDTDSGQIAPPGNYQIFGQYLGAGQVESAETLVNSTVESVSLRPTVLGIQLRGLGEYAFSSIEEIG